MASTLITVANTTARDALSPAVGDTVYQIDNKKINVCASVGPVVWRSYDSDGVAVNDTDITGLSPHLWLDPRYSSAFFTDSGKGTPVTADGKRVGCFADRSGNGFDFVQSTEANKPTLCTESGIGAVPSLVYSSTDQLDFVGDTDSEISAANLTLFFVWRASTEGGQWLLQGTANSNEPRMRINNSGSNFVYNWYPFGSEETSGTGGVIFSTTPAAADSFHARHIYCLKTNSSANRTYTYRNGGSDIAGSTAAPTGVFLEDTETFKVFQSTSGAYAPNWLFEFLVFDSSLSDANVNKVNSYLGAKHGITVTDVS
jgi:hypothetical protein